MFAFDRYWRLLSAYLTPLRGHVALLAALVLGGIGLQLASPQIIGRFIDATQRGAADGPLIGLALAYIWPSAWPASARSTSARTWAGGPPTACAPTWPATCSASTLASTKPTPPAS
jgi:hypothetical protein